MAPMSRRALELGLSGFSILALALGLLALRRSQEGWTDADSVLLGIFLVSVLGAHVALVWRARCADQVLVPVVAMLMALGLLVAARLSPALALRQALWILLGVGAVAGILFTLPRVDWLARFRYSWLTLGLLVLATTLIFGVDPNGSGSRLWLGVGGAYFQPSEALKIVSAIFFASYLADNRLLIAHAPLKIGWVQLPPLPYLVPLLTAWGLAMTLLLWQRDLGAALLFYLVFAAFLYVATGRRYLAVALFFLVLGAFAAYFWFEHVNLRTRIWLDPWPFASDEGYQVIQALTAYAAGGILGTGLGLGYPEYVPAAHTDFVLAVVAEELGLAGSLGVVALYVALVHRMFRIALHARSEFAILLGTGLGVTLGLQAAIIMAANLRLMPITGITLPFLSYGGSSLLANLAMIALVLRVSEESSTETKVDPSAN